MVTEQQLAAYAEVITTVGLHVEPADWLVIKTSIEQGPLVRAISADAYDKGADNVTVLWYHPEAERTRYTHGSADAWGEICHEADAINFASASGASILRILDEDPQLYADIDPERVAIHRRAFDAARGPTLERMASHQVVWTIAAAASPGWASRIFPELDVDDAVERLWAAILRSCRADVPDPTAAWQRHLAELASRDAHLTERRYDRLHFRAAGTDLIVGLPADHRWVAGAKGLHGSVPNLPTEEVFTAPDRLRVDGVVRATKPLSYLGTMIEGLELHLEQGRVVETAATSGRGALEQLIATDDGARYLGEVALAPQSSLVAAQGLVWRNALFDENDASHITLGRAYAASLAGGTTMSAEDRLRAGLNASEIHVDFVIGSDTLEVTGITADGSEEPLLSAGEWAFTTER